MTRLALVLGCALAALTATAYAHDRLIIRRGPAVDIDANSDGWVSRAEASGAAEQAFAALDSNGDGRLTEEDRPRAQRLSFDLEDGERRVIILRGGDDDDDLEEHAERAARHAERMAHHAEHQAREAEREAEALEEEIERRVERHVERIERRGGEDDLGRELHLRAPHPPHPPGPPHFMMLIANSDEADRDGDGSLSREEFIAQHLRFFDASDANGDGRVRFEPPPEPPEAPEPPQAPRR